MGPWLKVSSNRLVKPGIEPVTPGLQGKWFIHYTTVAPARLSVWPDLGPNCLQKLSADVTSRQRVKPCSDIFDNVQ